MIFRRPLAIPGQFSKNGNSYFDDRLPSATKNPYFDDRLPSAEGKGEQTLRIYISIAFAEIDFWDPDLHTSQRFQQKN